MDMNSNGGLTSSVTEGNSSKLIVVKLDPSLQVGWEREVPDTWYQTHVWETRMMAYSATAYSFKSYRSVGPVRGLGHRNDWAALVLGLHINHTRSQLQIAIKMLS